MLKSSIELLVKNQKVFFKKGPEIAIGGIVYGPLQQAHPVGNVFPIANGIASNGSSAQKPGTCLLKNGEMVQGTFQEMPTHVLYSKTEGLSTLTPYLHEKMLKELAKINPRDNGDLKL